MILPTELVESLANLPPTRYACAAGTVVCFYDFILTFPNEVRYVWAPREKLSITKVMFLWNRYAVLGWLVLGNYHISGFRGPLTDRVSFSLCKVTIIGTGIAQGISIIIGVQLLALRVMALYKYERRIRIGVILWLTLCHAALCGMTLAAVIRMYREFAILFFLPGINTCYTVIDIASKLVYIPPLFAESVLLILQIAKHVKSRKTREAYQSPLMVTLYRDGYIYFATIMTIRLLCLFMFVFGPGSLRLIGNQLDFSLTLISRFFLQLRAAAKKLYEETITDFSTTGDFHMGDWSRRTGDLPSQK
ncbi:hypothetical protein M408DRAFT_63533 [Serendipita vermifera MAFF 305830]|uniref:DUF6533 domain-containing protein n=1 Tax=Serendipita vermifera MAFF 305830 TaxID=933852 RepID=A0A0C2XTJ7_SERVB|nr:hypothetical protein M408DRAFT_63533 [Serendipita vermifera MAFF 305830]